MVDEQEDQEDQEQQQRLQAGMGLVAGIPGTNYGMNLAALQIRRELRRLLEGEEQNRLNQDALQNADAPNQQAAHMNRDEPPRVREPPGWIEWLEEHNARVARFNQEFRGGTDRNFSRERCDLHRQFQEAHAIYFGNPDPNEVAEMEATNRAAEALRRGGWSSYRWDRSDPEHPDQIARQQRQELDELWGENRTYFRQIFETHFPNDQIQQQISALRSINHILRQILPGNPNHHNE